MSQIIGHISQVIGPVVDVYFEGKGIDTDLLLPSIHKQQQLLTAKVRIYLIKIMI